MITNNITDPQNYAVGQIHLSIQVSRNGKVCNTLEEDVYSNEKERFVTDSRGDTGRCKKCYEAYKSHTIVKKYLTIYDEDEKRYMDIKTFLRKLNDDQTAKEKEIHVLDNTINNLLLDTKKYRSNDTIDTMMRCIDKIKDEDIKKELRNKVLSK